MILPEYWLQGPKIEIDPKILSDINQLIWGIKSKGINIRIEYRFPIPKWQFISYLAEKHRVVLHGTGDPDIQVFEPRASNDLSEFGAQTAVYAAGDGLWAMFFAILDREHYPMVTSNACIRLKDKNGRISEPYYVFSISKTALRQHPWRNGVIYILPGDTFVHQPSIQFGPYEVRIPQFASLVPVKPYAQLEVTPEDFPFLKDIRGIDDARLAEYGQAMQTGSPWPAEG